MKTANSEILALIFSVMAIFVLSGCGGSGRSSDGEVTLIIDAGQDKKVAAGHVVSLHGAAKMSDGNTYTSFEESWTQEDDNPSVTLNNADTFNPTFIAPDVQVETLLLFQLQGNSGDFESTDVVGVYVRPTTVPQLLPSTPISTHSDSNVTLHATTVPSAVGDTLTHQWTHESGSHVTLTTPNASSTDIVIPAESTPSTIVITHTVTNTATGLTAQVPHVIHALVPTLIFDVIVTPPLLVYEALQNSLHLTIAGGTTPYTIVWSQKTGVHLTIDDSDPLNPTFKADLVDADQVAVLQVVVTDTGGKSITKEIAMLITNVIFKIQAGGDPVIRGSHELFLHAGPILAPGKPKYEPIAYVWTQTLGRDAVIGAAKDPANPHITIPDGEGTYRFRVDATDSAGHKDWQEVDVKAFADIHMNAGIDFQANENTPVALAGRSVGISANATFKWIQTGGTTVTLTNDTTLTPVFTAPFTKGQYMENVTFELTVTEGSVSQSDSVTVNIVPGVPLITVQQPIHIPLNGDGPASCQAIGDNGPFTFAWTIAGTDAHIRPDTTNSSVALIHADSVPASPVELTCEVTDNQGRKSSEVGYILIFDTPTIVLSATPSISKSINESEIGILSVHAQGGTGPYSYEWIMTPPAVGTISDEHSANASFNPNLVGPHGASQTFDVKVSDGNGASILVHAGAMTINNLPFTVGPVSGTNGQVHPGDPIMLSVVAKWGSAPYTYQWLEGHTPINGATLNTLTVSAPSEPDGTALRYRVEVTDSDGKLVPSNERKVIVQR